MFFIVVAMIDFAFLFRYKLENEFSFEIQDNRSLVVAQIILESIIIIQLIGIVFSTLSESMESVDIEEDLVQTLFVFKVLRIDHSGNGFIYHLSRRYRT